MRVVLLFSLENQDQPPVSVRVRVRFWVMVRVSSFAI